MSLALSGHTGIISQNIPAKHCGYDGKVYGLHPGTLIVALEFEDYIRGSDCFVFLVFDRVILLLGKLSCSVVDAE